MKVRCSDNSPSVVVEHLEGATDMDKVSHFVGLDYHQNSLQVCIMDRQARVKLNRRCGNDLASLLPVLGEVGPVGKIALEACEGAAELAEALCEAGPWTVELAHPLYVSKLKGSPDKSDLSDAKLLADLTRVGYLPRVWLAPRSIRQLRQLVGHRQRLADDRRALKLRVGAVLRNERVKVAGTRWTIQWIAAVRGHGSLSESSRWLIEELFDELGYVMQKLARTEQRLRQVTQEDSVIAKLRTLEGIGEITAWVLRAAIGRFDRFANAKQLCRYCGLTPRNTASGQRQTQGALIDVVDRRLRAILIQAAQRLIRTEPRWHTLAEGMVRRGKPRNVAVTAVANRWMRTVHHRMTRATA